MGGDYNSVLCYVYYVQLWNVMCDKHTISYITVLCICYAMRVDYTSGDIRILIGTAYTRAVFY